MPETGRVDSYTAGTYEIKDLVPPHGHTWRERVTLLGCGAVTARELPRRPIDFLELDLTGAGLAPEEPIPAGELVDDGISDGVGPVVEAALGEPKPEMDPLTAQLLEIDLFSPPRRRRSQPDRLGARALGYPAGSFILVGGLLFALGIYGKNNSGFESSRHTAIDEMCDQGDQAQWTLIRGTDVLTAHPQEVAVQVQHTKKRATPSVLAEMGRVPFSCVDGKAPRLVTGYHPIEKDEVRVAAFGEAGNELGVGTYHVAMDPRSLKDWKEDMKEGGTAVVPGATPQDTWAYVQSGKDTLGCSVHDKSANLYCVDALANTGLKIQSR